MKHIFQSTDAKLAQRKLAFQSQFQQTHMMTIR